MQFLQHSLTVHGVERQVFKMKYKGTHKTQSLTLGEKLNMKR